MKKKILERNNGKPENSNGHIHMNLEE